MFLPSQLNLYENDSNSSRKISFAPLDTAASYDALNANANANADADDRSDAINGANAKNARAGEGTKNYTGKEILAFIVRNRHRGLAFHDYSYGQILKEVQDSLKCDCLFLAARNNQLIGVGTAKIKHPGELYVINTLTSCSLGLKLLLSAFFARFPNWILSALHGKSGRKIQLNQRALRKLFYGR